MSWGGQIDRAVDWVLSVVSPRRAEMRQHLRRFDSDQEYRETFLAMMGARGYRAAKGSSKTTPWNSFGPRSADSEILDQLPDLRSKARELGRDDPIASGLVGTFVRNVIGTGNAPQARNTERDKNDSLEAAFKQRRNELAPAEGVTFGGFQRLVFERVFEDGEVLTKKTITRPGEPLWFEVVEADRLMTPRDAQAKDPEGDIRDGVERDRFSRPVAYWISKRHPGDHVGLVLNQNEFVRVPLESCKHLFVKGRPGQSRGVTKFHAVLQDLRDLDLLILAALKRTQIAVCFAAFIKSEQRLDRLFEVTAEKHGYKLDQKIEPGMLFKLYPGESIETLIPNFPVPEFAPFVIMLARRIGAALGVSWQIVLKDFSESTYSSARTDLLESRQVFRILQHWFQESLLDWIWFEVLADARLRGDERLQDCTDDELREVSWIANGWAWVDPEKEAKATEIQLDAGLTTLRDVAAARGQDWEELMRQRLLEEKREKELRAELGLEPADSSSDSGPRLADAA